MEWCEFLSLVRSRVRAEVESLLPGWSEYLERLSPSYEPARVVYTCADPERLADENVLRLAVAGVLSRYGVAALARGFASTSGSSTSWTTSAGGT